jgi:hypothetical protein
MEAAVSDPAALIAKDVEWEIIRVCGEHFWRDPQLAERVRYALLAAEERGKAAAPAAEDGELLDWLESEACGHFTNWMEQMRDRYGKDDCLRDLIRAAMRADAQQGEQM